MPLTNASLSGLVRTTLTNDPVTSKTLSYLVGLKWVLKRLCVRLVFAFFGTPGRQRPLRFFFYVAAITKRSTSNPRGAHSTAASEPENWAKKEKEYRQTTGTTSPTSRKQLSGKLVKTYKPGQIVPDEPTIAYADSPLRRGGNGRDRR